MELGRVPPEEKGGQAVREEGEWGGGRQRLRGPARPVNDNKTEAGFESRWPLLVRHPLSSGNRFRYPNPFPPHTAAWVAALLALWSFGGDDSSRMHHATYRAVDSPYWTGGCGTAPAAET